MVNERQPNEGITESIQAQWKEIPIDVDQQENHIKQQVIIVVSSRPQVNNEKVLGKNTKDSTNDDKNSDQLEVKL